MLSSLIHEAMYVAAASDKQQGGGLRPTHKKSLQTQKRVWRDVLFTLYFGMAIQPTRKRRFFLFGGLVLPMIYKKRADKL